MAKARWLYERKANHAAPTAIVLKTTRACNLRCSYCYSYGGSDSRVLPLDLAMRMVDEVSALNGLPFTIYLHGGEPLLCEDFLVGFVSAMSTRDYYLRVTIGVQTNGTLITQRWAEFFRKWCIGVGVSLDGVSRETNRFRTFPTKENCLDRVVGGLDILRKNGIAVALLTVVTNQNVTHLLEILEFAKSRGITDLVFNDFIPRGYGSSLGDLMPSGTTLFEAMKEVVNWLVCHNSANPHSRIYERNLSYLVRNILDPERKPYMCLSSPCGAGSKHLALDVDGTVYACDVFIGDPEFAVGNLYRQTLREMMLSSSVVKRLNARSTSSIKKCFECEIKPHCSGGCAALAFYVNGVLDKEAPTCDYYRKMIPFLRTQIYDQLLDPSLLTRHPYGKRIGARCSGHGSEL
ncbi:MAG: radical SAM protein [Firmicutes bacterium]|nr:radical SAM protein [Candidatus Fermentithermobacillaceae bacterium]